MQSINLIPQKEVNEQTQQKALKLSTVFSIVLLVLVAGISGYFVFRERNVNGQIDVLNNEIGSLRQRISGMSEIEVYARNLDKKYSTLKEIFAQRNLYSLLSAEVQLRTPEGVVIDSITLQKDNRINISGFANNYISIAAFTNQLIDKDFDRGDSNLKNLFTTVTLNSVSLEKSKNVVSYSINVDIDNTLLKQK